MYFFDVSSFLTFGWNKWESLNGGVTCTADKRCSSPMILSSIYWVPLQSSTSSAEMADNLLMESGEPPSLQDCRVQPKQIDMHSN